MADALLDNQAAPTTPASGKSVLWVDSTTKKLVDTDDAGRHYGTLSRNSAVASQGAGFAADTYVTNSGLLIPSFGMQAGQLYRWIITASKTAAGIAAAIYTIRVGPNQTTADTARFTITAAQVQTASIDNGTLFVTVQVRNVGAAGVLAGAASWIHSISGGGFGGSTDGVAASYDNTASGGQYVGLSINGGAAAAWTLTSVHAELIG